MEFNLNLPPKKVDLTKEVVSIPTDEPFDIQTKTVENIFASMDRSKVVPTMFLKGNAGTGKTYSLQQWADNNPDEALLTASTGIAAINLGYGAITIHSVLRVFDYQNLARRYEAGTLHGDVQAIAEKYQNIVIEECPMLSSGFIDIIYSCMYDINTDGGIFGAETNKLGLVLVGDFGQLPPVRTPDMKLPDEWQYAFEARCWPEFAKSTVHLTKVWRQQDSTFLEALDAMRQNKAQLAVQKLKESGVKFRPVIDRNFNGTTIIPTNKGVNSFNEYRMNKLPGRSIDSPVVRRGEQHAGWKELPFIQAFKKNALVMILVNETENHRYANGDLGLVKGYEKDKGFAIELLRTKKMVWIPKLTRCNFAHMEPNPKVIKGFESYLDKFNRWVIGECEYFPMRVAYATTVHKSQGLTLSEVQLDATAPFLAKYNMSYVGISRVKDPQGLTIVGSPMSLQGKIKMDPKVMPYV